MYGNASIVKYTNLDKYAASSIKIKIVNMMPIVALKISTIEFLKNILLITNIKNGINTTTENNVGI